MGGITEKITEFIKDLLTGWITSNLDTMFTDVNTKVETIATEVGKTPQNWNSGIFSMIKNLSDNVIVPIAGMIITFVLCYELISMIMEKNNMHDTDTFMFFKYIFKMWVAVYLVTHTFDIAMAIFDVANHVVSNAGGMITGSASIDVTEALKTLLETQIEDMGIGELLGLGLETMLVSLCLKIISVLITVILYGRMIEIYLYVSVAPIPFSTFTNREWGSIGNNYVKALLALGFQGFFMMVCVAIYAVLVMLLQLRIIFIQLSGQLQHIQLFYVSACLRPVPWQNQSSMHIRRKQEYGICSSAERFFKNKDKISTEFN